MYELDAKLCRRWVSGNGHRSARLGIKLILYLYFYLYCCLLNLALLFFFSAFCTYLSDSHLSGGACQASA